MPDPHDGRRRVAYRVTSPLTGQGLPRWVLSCGIPSERITPRATAAASTGIMTENEADLAEALAHPELRGRIAARITLRTAVQRQITCPYTGNLLDVRDAVLLDGSDHGGSMHIMSASAYEAVIKANGTLGNLERKLGYRVDIHDGRILFGDQAPGPQLET